MITFHHCSFSCQLSYVFISLFQWTSFTNDENQWSDFVSPWCKDENCIIDSACFDGKNVPLGNFQRQFQTIISVNSVIVLSFCIASIESSVAIHLKEHVRGSLLDREREREREFNFFAKIHTIICEFPTNSVVSFSPYKRWSKGKSFIERLVFLLFLTEHDISYSQFNSVIKVAPVNYEIISVPYLYVLPVKIIEEFNRIEMLSIHHFFAAFLWLFTVNNTFLMPNKNITELIVSCFGIFSIRIRATHKVILNAYNLIGFQFIIGYDSRKTKSHNTYSNWNLFSRF